MVSVTVSSIVDAVRVSLDELRPNASYMAGVQDSDNEDLDALIRGKIEEAVSLVHGRAAAGLVNHVAPVVQPIGVSADGLVLLVDVPVDMMRFVALKAVDSPHTVTVLYEDGSPEAVWQTDDYTCGTWERPQAVLRRHGLVNKIHYYKLQTPLLTNPAEPASSCVQLLSYLRHPSIQDGSIEICETLKDAVISMLTGMVLTAFKDEHADSFFSMAKLQMGLQ